MIYNRMDGWMDKEKCSIPISIFGGRYFISNCNTKKCKKKKKVEILMSLS
jgi:hypothetical protein